MARGSSYCKPPHQVDGVFLLVSYKSGSSMLDTSNAVLVQPDGCPRGEQEGGGCDVTSLSLTITDPTDAVGRLSRGDSKVNHKLN